MIPFPRTNHEIVVEAFDEYRRLCDSVDPDTFLLPDHEQAELLARIKQAREATIEALVSYCPSRWRRTQYATTTRTVTPARPASIVRQPCESEQEIVGGRVVHRPYRIAFHGDQITCVDRDGKMYVALKPTCSAIGLIYVNEEKRLQRAKWATPAVMPTIAADGKRRSMTFIDRRTFAMWLASLDADKVGNRAIREKIDLYQAEAADVLDRHFFGVQGQGQVQSSTPATQGRGGRSSAWGGDSADIMGVVRHQEEEGRPLAEVCLRFRA